VQAIELTHRLRVFRFPQVDYASAWRWQTETAADVRDGAGEALALLQHSPVYTFGRRVRREHLLLDEQSLRQRGADVVESDRGGDVTFHGPGQLVAYPILNLRQRGLGPVDYVRALEETMIRTLAAFGLNGERVAGRPGVWLDHAKVGAIGVRVHGGVSLHGLALNVDTDLSWFAAIVPCGLSGAGVTSMQRALGFSPSVDAITEELIEAFADIFDSDLRIESYLPASPLASLPEVAHGR
jgi:lipoyl(octanoyl) transferase